MKRVLLIIALLSGFAVNTAKAAEEGSWSLGILAGYGFGSEFKTTLDTEAPSIWNFGLGARLGYTFESGLYLGATGIYHFGESTTGSLTGVSVKDEASVKPLYFGGEVGLTMLRGELISLRPYVGLGYSVFKTELTSSSLNIDDTDSFFTVNPGVLAMISLGNLYVGADFRYYIVTDTPGGFDANAFGLYASFGVGL